MKFLFVCTHNRCRSILAEAVTRHLSDGRIEAKSAGSQPSGQVHPLSIKHLQARGIATDNLTSNSWDEFEDWEPDVVITVCDSAAAEQCPLWLGDSINVHWGLSDPSKMEGSNEAVACAFNQTIDIIRGRVEQFLAQDFEKYSAEKLQNELEKLGNNNGSF